jgi:hypothetical protein
MTSPNGTKPTILSDLMLVADFRFLLKPLKMGKYKRVKFDENVYVRETITREELNEHKLKDKIWWCADDYRKFNDESNQDIFKFMLKFPGIDYFTARKMIYNYHFLEVLDSINE